METFPSRWRQVRLGALIGFAVILCAAAPDNMHVQIGDVGPLAQPEPAVAKPLSFQNTIYQAAPVPDEDVEAPPGKVETEAHLSPKFLFPNSLYQGDGYSYAPTQQGTLHRRKGGAAGLGLSVPVEQ